MNTLSSAEARLEEALRDQLPEPFVVYHSASWLIKEPGQAPRDGEADFVVAHPELGIMVIEVKGGGIRRAGGTWESVDRNGTAHRIKDPFRQVADEMHDLRRIASARQDWPAHEVRFCRAVAFPDSHLRPGADAGRAGGDRHRRGRPPPPRGSASATSSTGGPVTPRKGGAVGRPAPSASRPSTPCSAAISRSPLPSSSSWPTTSARSSASPSSSSTSWTTCGRSGAR